MAEVLTLPDLPADRDLEGATGSLFFVGNATVLIRCGGFTVLTDPTFVHRHEKVPLGYGLSTTRLTDPAVDIADLPPLDLVLLSHFHGDHFDQVAQRDLDRDLPIVTTPQSAKELEGIGFRRTHALDTWEALEVRRGTSTLRITACPGRHGPGVADLVLPDVMGSVLELSPDGAAVTRRLYVSGDTLLYDDLEEIPRRFPDIDVGLFHLGGTTVLGIMVTMDAEQGAGAVELVSPAAALPVHYDDYDVFTSGLQDFVEETRRRGLADRIHPWERGDTFPL
jgi:L-ascorbate metabolism protein UlaG (beta-lactamase superfamily)